MKLEALRRFRAVPQATALLLVLSAATYWVAAAATGGASLAEIDRLIGLAHCTADRQCRVADIGVRPCGGAESHRAWSVRDTDANTLQRQLRAYADERRRRNEAEGLLSTCELLPTPKTRCEFGGAPLGRCVLHSANGGIR